MEILYVSVLSSSRLINKLHNESGLNPGFQAQKFHRLIASGFVKNHVNFQTLTGLPISRDISKKLFWKGFSESEDGVNYKYIPFVNLSVLRQICLFLYAFVYTIHWGLTNRKDKVIVCDVLNVSICVGSLWASKVVGVRSVGIMTDMPGLMVNQSHDVKRRSIKSLFTKFNKSYLSCFSSYVFLTEQMNSAVNRKSRPYLVMEGLVDEGMSDVIMYTKESFSTSCDERIILYAGGLHEKYGLKTLVEAFLLLPHNDIRLHLYGNGPFVKQLKDDYCKRDPRIVYHGIVTNEEVIKAELEATLLVNPRPTNEVFTQYSFPSKNMEYMVSGTPVLTTKLPGMPEEYYTYIYMFDDESVPGFTEKMKEVLSIPTEDLHEKGIKAKQFVLQKKNNVWQTKRIVEMIKNLLN